MEELERRNGEGLTKVCKELKSLRLKVNEGKTVYMIMATPGIRRRDGNINSKIQICRKTVQNVKIGKVLGLVVSDDLSWRDQVDKVTKLCTAKLSGLWRCTSILEAQERKTKAEAIILPRLYYCLETTSTGLKSNMERLQGVQSAAARWVLQIRKGLKKLGWLSVCQQAAYQTVKMALQILKRKTPERLYEILTSMKSGQRVRKELSEDNIKRLKLSTRKAWSTRALRWIGMMPTSLLEMDFNFKSSNKALKTWIKHRVPARGDKILWGKVMRGVGEQGDEPRRQDQGPDGPQYNVGAEPEVGLQERQHNPEVHDEQGHGSTMARRGQATDEEGSQEGAKQRPGSKAGHQLCLLRRRHSPARGSKDTAACPQLRLVQTKVIYICAVYFNIIKQP